MAVKRNMNHPDTFFYRFTAHLGLGFNTFLCPFAVYFVRYSQVVFHNLPHFSREQYYKVTSAVHYVQFSTLCTADVTL